MLRLDHFLSKKLAHRRGRGSNKKRKNFKHYKKGFIYCYININYKIFIKERRRCYTQQKLLMIKENVFFEPYDQETDDFFDALNSYSTVSYEELVERELNSDCDYDCSSCPNCPYCEYNN